MYRTTKRSSDFSIRAGVFHGPAAILSGSTRNFERTLRSLRLPTDPELIIGTDDYLKGIRDVIRMAGDEDFFLRVSLEQELDELGVFGRAIVSANSLWEALQTAATTLKYYQNNSEIVIRTYRGKCRIWYFTSLKAQDASKDIQYTMGLLAKIVFLARAQTEPDITIAYPGASPAHFKNISSVVSVRNSNQGYIEFHEDLLKARMSKSDTVRAVVLARYLKGKSLFEAPQTEKSELVAGLVRASFGIVPWSLADTSKVLGVGPRSLQMQLKDEGTAFREIVQAERHKEACRLLGSGSSIDDTADTLGFVHRQSFSEAFASWEGCSPSVYAKQALAS